MKFFVKLCQDLQQEKKIHLWCNSGFPCFMGNSSRGLVEAAVMVGALGG